MGTEYRLCRKAEKEERHHRHEDSRRMYSVSSQSVMRGKWKSNWRNRAAKKDFARTEKISKGI
jgi:hypothetical protein